MINGKRFVLISAVIFILSLYPSGTAAAMMPAAEMERAAESEPTPEAAAKTEQAAESESKPEAEAKEESESKPEAEAKEESESKPEAEAKEESEPKPEAEAKEESELKSEAKAAAETEQCAEPEAEADRIASAAELTAWLESHKYSGGRAKLTDDIILEEAYSFTPYANMPPLTVETDGYTILVRADVELWSDGRLTFRGEGGERGIFHVERSGMLLLDGVDVEASGGGSRCALWQEEGAGLILGETFASSRVSGGIHYAKTPLVMEAEHVCVVVEKGELLDGRLPAEVACVVNYQGARLEHESAAVSWNTEGMEEQQTKRRRFQTEGDFAQAAADVNAVCTVVYHDYPLTFTKAEAFIRSSAYTFRGDYIRSGEASAAAASPEYSFDGENWISEGENNILKADNGYYIVFPCDQWDVAAHPYIYIRLRGEAGEQVYYSNVLRYEADHMDVVEDMGGSRGGGTAIVNPSGDPEKPENPDEPGKLTEPGNPNESDGSAESGNPDESDKAAVPGNLSEPGKLTALGNPNGPGKLTEPENPSGAGKPTAPGNPSGPGNSAQPENPSKPENPEKTDSPSNSIITGEPGEADQSAEADRPQQPFEPAAVKQITLTAADGSMAGLAFLLVFLSAAAGGGAYLFASRGTKR